MSLRVDLADFLPAYLVEAEELLAAANTHLLALETGLSSGTTSLQGMVSLLSRHVRRARPFQD